MKPTFAATLLAAAAIATTPAAAQSPQELNDLEIAHVAYNAGEIDIRYAHLALSTSESPAIREFAELMIRDHSAVNDAAVALIGALGVTPLDNAVSRELMSQAATLRRELRGLEGSAFDRRYAENELAYHRFVNTAVETIFIPNVATPELRALLEDALATFKAHEAHAEAMVEQLS